MKTNIEQPEVHREKILKILEEMGYPEWKVINLYLYGSRIYKTSHDNSDYDIMAIVKSMDDGKEIMVDNYNIHIYTPDSFERNLREYNIVSLECLFSPKWAKILEKQEFHADISSIKIKKVFGWKSYASFNKAKIKIREGDYYRGLKSLFHSIRILDFGIQIIKNGRITNFSSSNKFWQMILREQDKSPTVKWNKFKRPFFSIRRSMYSKMMGTYSRDDEQKSLEQCEQTVQSVQSEQNETNKEK